MVTETDLDTYTAPAVTDLGSLAELTAQFDASFQGTVAKLVTLAVASVPAGGGGGNTPQQTPPGGGGSQPLTPSGNVQPNTTTGTTTTPTSGGQDAPTSKTDPGLGDVRNNRSTGGGTAGSGWGGTAGSGGGVGGGELSGAESGRLPFTGYAAMMVAGVGAALAGSGAALRSKLKPRRQAR